jgi:hypothetical protein
MSAIYIAKAGKTSGPFTQTEIDAMRASGELAGYNWIWNETTAAWEPIDAAPAPPAPPGFGSMPKAAATVTRPTPAPAQVSVARLFSVPDEVSTALQAICHDHLNVVAGMIKKAGESGCDFIAETGEATHSGPIFMKDMPVRLNIVDPLTGVSMTVRAEVVQAMRDSGLWKYRLSWASCPEIILNGLNGAA